MIRKLVFLLFLAALVDASPLVAQNYTFDFNANGKRVCLVESEVDLNIPSVTIKLLDHSQNSTYATSIFRRALYGTGADWQLVASDLPAGTPEWADTDVNLGDVWEYQTKRADSWSYNSQTYDATGYTVGALLKDNTDYQGQLILLVASDVVDSLPEKYSRLKTELTGDGWFVNELIVSKATSWYSGDTVVTIRNQIISVYNAAPTFDKPKVLFILGHVPMPRSGSTEVTAPDGHDQNKGARGFDGYYADIDGIYTDDATFDPGGLQTPDAINYPGDFKWDQDFFSSDSELAFGRVDFFEIDDYPLTEMGMVERYLDKLSSYKNVDDGFEMGEKTAFHDGYENSNDGSFRSFPSISKSENIYEDTTEDQHPQWVQEHGPFKIYMQNQSTPEISEWNSYGMNATVFSSDQSYWGYSDCSSISSVYSRIRALLASEAKCVVALWTTTTVNTFYQSCTGDPLGFAIREKINTNTTNNNIETPQSEWDTEDWWNRTHLTYSGDPTVRLYQVKPPSNLTISNIDGSATLSWDAAPDFGILGYVIYKSSTEFGIYTKITASPIAALEFVDLDYQQYDWYMVRAVKEMESGCGQFLQPSQGVFTQGEFLISHSNYALETHLSIYPNPCQNQVTVDADQNISALQLLTIDGRKVLEKTNLRTTKIELDLSQERAGIFFLIVQADGMMLKRKVVVVD